MSSKSPIHKINKAVSHLSREQVADDQIITLINSDDGSEQFGSNISQLQFDDGTYGCHFSHERKPRVRVYKLFLALVTVIAIVLFVVIWISVRNQVFHKDIKVKPDSQVYAVLEYSAMNLSLFSRENKRYLSINVGLNFTSDLSYKKSQDCSDGKNSGNVCMKWKTAKLEINPEIIEHNHKQLNCFHVTWNTNENISPSDCIYIGENERTDHVWFDTHNFKMWPKDADQDLEYYSSVPKEKCSNDSLLYVPGSISSKTGIPLEKMGGTVVEPLWLLSNGVMIKMAMHDQIRINSLICNTNKSHLCLGTQGLTDHHSKLHQTSSDIFNASMLNYVMCVHDSITDLHNTFLHNFTHKGHGAQNLSTVTNTEIKFENGHLENITPTAKQENCNLLFEKPLWNLVIQEQNYTQENVYIEIEHIKDIGGTIFLNILSEISTKIGDYDILKDTQNISNYIHCLHQSNFSVMLPVTPFIHHASKNFDVGLKKDYFIKTTGGHNTLIQITEKHLEYHVAVVDLTNDDASKWFTSNLKSFYESSGADYLHFIHGQATWLPQNSAMNKTLHNTAYYSTLYAMIANQVSKCSVSDVAFSTQPLKQIVMLSPVVDVHLTLKEALSAGLAGYPFFIANLPSSLKEAAKYINVKMLEQGFIQWVEMVTFFPVMHIPWDYTTLQNTGVNTTKIADVVRRCTKIRNSPKILAILKNAIAEAMQDGKPIVRPVWMASGLPGHTNGSDVLSKTFKISDQFLVGNDLLVAPVMEINRFTRTIYFPPGKWLNILSQHLIHSGEQGKWESEYPAKQIPVFLRKA